MQNFQWHNLEGQARGPEGYGIKSEGARSKRAGVDRERGSPQSKEPEGQGIGRAKGVGRASGHRARGQKTKSQRAGGHRYRGPKGLRDSGQGYPENQGSP